MPWLIDFGELDQGDCFTAPNSYMEDGTEIVWMKAGGEVLPDGELGYAVALNGPETGLVETFASDLTVTRYQSALREI